MSAALSRDLGRRVAGFINNGLALQLVYPIFTHLARITVEKFYRGIWSRWIKDTAREDLTEAGASSWLTAVAP
jgi:hypothetical protein